MTEAETNEQVESGGSEGKPTEATFLQFLSGMAAQALVHLGAIANPLTGQTSVDVPNARYSIDLLAILDEKTKGNLTDEEARYLAAALHELRMRFIQVNKPADDTKSDGEANEEDAVRETNDQADNNSDDNS